MRCSRRRPRSRRVHRCLAELADLGVEEVLRPRLAAARLAAAQYDRCFYPEGADPPARGDLRIGRPQRGTVHARGADARDPRPRRHADHARGRRTHRRARPRIALSAAGRHGPRPSRAAVAGARRGDRRARTHRARSPTHPRIGADTHGWTTQRIQDHRDRRHRPRSVRRDAARRHGRRGGPGRASRRRSRSGARRAPTSTCCCAGAGTWRSTSSIPTVSRRCSRSSSRPTR